MIQTTKRQKYHGKTYTVSFLKDLKDFDYVISVKDDAGNEDDFGGSKDEIFRGEPEITTFIGDLSLGSTDVGHSALDRITSNMAKPKLTFSSRN